MNLSAEGKQGKTIIGRLKPGQELVEGIKELAEKHSIKSGYIPVLLGGLKKVKLVSMAKAEDDNKPKDAEAEYAEPLEYFGAGTISQQDGKVSVHIHMSAAQAGNKTLSGHLVSGEIVIHTEIVIVEITGVKVVRKADPEVFGYPLLGFE